MVEKARKLLLQGKFPNCILSKAISNYQEIIRIHLAEEKKIALLGITFQTLAALWLFYVCAIFSPELGESKRTKAIELPIIYYLRLKRHAFLSHSSLESVFALGHGGTDRRN